MLQWLLFPANHAVIATRLHILSTDTCQFRGSWSAVVCIHKQLSWQCLICVDPQHMDLALTRSDSAETLCNEERSKSTLSYMYWSLEHCRPWLEQSNLSAYILLEIILLMAVDHEGTGGQVPSEFGVGGTLRQIVPLRFRHRNTKMSVLWPSKYAKIRFRPELCPRPHWESSRRSPKPPSQLGRGHPSPYPIPLGTDPSSALAMRPPRTPARSMPMILLILKLI